MLLRQSSVATETKNKQSTPRELEAVADPGPAVRVPSASAAASQSPPAASITALRSSTPRHLGLAAIRISLAGASFGTNIARPDCPKATLSGRHDAPGRRKSDLKRGCRSALSAPERSSRQSLCEGQ